MMFEMIWPQKTWVTDYQIDVWFWDAVANGDISNEYKTDSEFIHSKKGEIKNAEKKALELHNAGLITLGKGRA